jgi:RHS repeat-associated protein
VRYTWDVINRMLTACNATGGARYEYRADGMRTMKIEELTLSWIPPDDSSDDADSSGYYDVITSVNKPTTRYYYDGQMCHEDDFTRKVSNVDTVDVTRYGLGARGIDRIEKVAGANLSNPTITVVYPIYDAHGNMVRTLAKNGSGYTVSAARVFGAWGEVRNTAGPTASKGKYVANLGHVQDDESGLVYMRARYYEAQIGRFISEDRAKAGVNWFNYCCNDPVNLIDESGHYPQQLLDLWLFDIEWCIMLSAAARVILAGALLLWSAEMIQKGSAMRGNMLTYFQQWNFVVEAGAVGASTPMIGSGPADQARATARMYSIALLVTFWILFDEETTLIQ